MDSSSSISLPIAILINVNIMLGSGIFINTAVLAQRAGLLGSLAYLSIGLLMLPLVFVIARLVERHPNGGFYAYGKGEIAPWAGFLAAWSYFVGKLAAVTLVIHVALRLIQTIITPLAVVNTLVLDAGLITLFCWLNLKNIRTSSIIQSLFMGLKSVPIMFAMLVGLYYLCTRGVASSLYVPFEALPFSLPIVLFGITGFEAACLVSKHIKDPARNTPRAIFTSYGLVICVAALYQLLFYLPLGTLLAQASDYRGVFPLLLGYGLPFSTQTIKTLIDILHLGIAASALGGSYGSLFINAWNLHTLAENNLLFFSSTFASLNGHKIAWACVIFEGAICFLYLAITQGMQLPLQQTTSLGCSIAYCVSALSLLAAYYRQRHALLLPLLGIANSMTLVGFCMYNLYTNGISSLSIFILLLCAGFVMFFIQQARHKAHHA